jgi:hypothetical protein
MQLHLIMLLHLIMPPVDLLKSGGTEVLARRYIVQSTKQQPSCNRHSDPEVVVCRCVCPAIQQGVFPAISALYLCCFLLSCLPAQSILLLMLLTFLLPDLLWYAVGGH